MTAKPLAVAEPSAIVSALMGNQAVLRQLQASVADLDPRQYQWAFNPSSGSIGQHTRHILDHYSCFYKGIDGTLVNYDARTRDHSIEADPQRACEAIDHTLALLETTTSQDHHANLFVISSTDINTTAPMTASTIARELIFLQSHTIHHMASIRMLSELQGISMRDSFGLSPATLKLEQGLD